MAAGNVASNVVIWGAVAFTAFTGVGAVFGPAAAGTMGTAGNGLQIIAGTGADGLSWGAEALQSALG
ncbi:MAG: hypothetical protein JKY71_01950 [Alphaproteobacteria bacterium]|nr:hypothetical protein [Alphaproteobacteria bacterium]